MGNPFGILTWYKPSTYVDTNLTNKPKHVGILSEITQTPSCKLNKILTTSFLYRASLLS